MLEAPLVARGEDRFVLRSFSPVTTVGGGVVLDPLPLVPGPRLRHRRLQAGQSPAERLAAWAVEAGLAGVPVAALAVRVGGLPGRVTAVIAAAGASVVTGGESLVGPATGAGTVSRLT